MRTGGCCALIRRKIALGTSRVLKLAKILTLLNQEQRRSAYLLMALMIVGIMLEALGISAVIPVLALMGASDPAVTYPSIRPVLSWIGNPGKLQLIAMAMVALTGIYAVKTAFLVLLSWMQARFAFQLQRSVSMQLFNGYLSQPYTFHLQRNSAHLINNVVHEAHVFTHYCVLSGMVLFSEGVLLAGIFALLMFVEPVGAGLVVLVLGGTGLCFYRITRTYILRWGKSRQLHEGWRVQHLQQGLSGVKDVKLLGREANFLANYEAHNAGAAEVEQRQNFFQQLPKLLFELLAVIGLAAVVLAMLYQGKPIEALVPTIGLFAACAFRLMPSMNRALLAMQSLRYSSPVIGALSKELKLFSSSPPVIARQSVRLEFNRELVIEDLRYAYSETTTSALRGVSIRIRCGASVGFIGQSGSGKTTLIDAILGLLTPTAGRIMVDGVDIQDNLRGWQDQIGYVSQTIFLTDDTLRRNIAFGLSDCEISEVALLRAIRSAQLEEFVGSLSLGLNTMVGERGVRLSGGQRQRIGIARALYHDPSVLVLDEATSALDSETESGVMNAVEALHGQKTIIIVTHRPSTISRCDQVYQLREGLVLLADEQSPITHHSPRV